MQQKLFQIFFFSQEAGASGNNIEKESQKPRPKLKIFIFWIFTENIFSVRNPVQAVVFCKRVLILQNNDSNSFTLKVD